MTRQVSIAGASGMWGDSMLSTAQLLGDSQIDYMTYECLAEITMAVMTRARQKDPGLGYATDVIETLIPRHLAEMSARGIKVVTNAGGVNPEAAAQVLRTKCKELGISLRIATVSGDDGLPHLAALQSAGIREMDRGTRIPEAPISANAYLGAFPIAAALDAGADIVITGRVVDSALTLGPLIHEFGWTADDLDQLAQGALAGHLIECGPQSTGGLITDWEEVASWANVGFPIVRVSADSRFVLTKPPGTDGKVSIKSATEQILYEIGNPAAYLLPDVACDFRHVTLRQTAPDVVHVSGARGGRPPPYLKLCAQEAAGWRIQWLVSITGREAVARAERTARDLLKRLRDMLAALGHDGFLDVSTEVLGSEQSYGAQAQASHAREVVLKLALSHTDRRALDLAAREMPSIGLAMAQGLSAGGTGRPRPSPMLQLHSFLVPRDMFAALIEMDGTPVPFVDPVRAYDMVQDHEVAPSGPLKLPDGPTVALPLMALAYARSGDKGNSANIGIAARHEDFVSLLRDQVTPKVVGAWFAHLVRGPVARFELPGLNAFNFLLKDALGGGGTASLRFDPQGKGFGQNLLDLPIELPKAMLSHPALKPIPEVIAARQV